ncbi:MAG: hypothetical protein J6J31_05780, partial [Thermoguttaceae bacterium]|nr:hypothetical protein [Thermoguttaceae bacterium]
MMGSGQMGTALRKPAVELTPTPWGKESISFARFVQPVLDRNCGKCHQNPEHDAYKKLNMVSRPSGKGWRSNVFSRPGETSPFTEPYMTLVSGDCGWGRSKVKNEKGVPVNLAGVFVVEGYGGRDPNNLATLPPYSAYSPTSTLIQNATSGNHHGVKVSQEDAERLIAWVDCNGPYLGDEEIRKMYDPYSKAIETVPPVRPRVASAPVINRFDIRQDGDSEKVSGALVLSEEAAKLKARDEVVLNLLRKKDEYMKKPFKGEILEASYGAKDTWLDVREKVNAQLTGVSFVDMPKYNTIFTDPIRDVVKTLRLKVRTEEGKVVEFELPENSPLLLP